MRAVHILLVLGIIAGSLESKAQMDELYVFRDDRKEHLKAAKKARKAARERSVRNDFYMRIHSLTSLSKAKMIVNMKRSHRVELQITDMNGTELATVYHGELPVGEHEFSYEPKRDLKKPFICKLIIDGKTEAMRVVKFNAF